MSPSLSRHCYCYCGAAAGAVAATDAVACWDPELFLLSPSWSRSCYCYRWVCSSIIAIALLLLLLVLLLLLLEYVSLLSRRLVCLHAHIFIYAYIYIHVCAIARLFCREHMVRPRAAFATVVFRGAYGASPCTATSYQSTSTVSNKKSHSSYSESLPTTTKFNPPRWYPIRNTESNHAFTTVRSSICS